MNQDGNNFLVFFDDECLMCNSFVHFVFKNKKTSHDQIYFTGLNGSKISLIENNSLFQGKSSTIYLLRNDELYSESEAIFMMLKQMKAPINWLSLFRFFPSGITNIIYRWVSKRRSAVKTTCTYNPKITQYIV